MAEAKARLKRLQNKDLPEAPDTALSTPKKPAVPKASTPSKATPKAAPKPTTPGPSAASATSCPA
jgi:hypothetical protein